MDSLAAREHQKVTHLATVATGATLRQRVARSLDRIIFYWLLTTIVLTAIPYGTVEPWSEALFEIIIFALGALWVLEGWLSGSWRVTGFSLLLPLLAAALFALMQTIPLPGPVPEQTAKLDGVWHSLSADPYETRLFTLKLLALTLAFALLLRYTSSQRRLRALIYLVIAIGCGSALFGIIRQTMQRGALGFILPLLGPDEGYGQFINRNHFALLMEMTLGLTLGLVVRKGVSRDRILIYLAAAVPVWTALVLSNSRGGIFSMLMQVLCLAILISLVPAPEPEGQVNIAEPQWRRVIGRSLVFRAALIACLIVALLFGIVWVGSDPLVSRFESVSTDEFNPENSELRHNASRVETWRATWKLIQDHPIVGVGFSGYWAVIPAYHDASGSVTPQQAHNDYLELLASGGLIGAALGIWFVVVVIKRVRVCLQATNRFRHAACFGAIIGLFGVAIHSFVDFGLHITINALIFLVLIVIGTVDVRAEDSRPRLYAEY